jgi:hypothetical protein
LRIFSGDGWRFEARVMIDALILVVLQLVLLHGPDGQEIEVNVAEISTLREPREDAQQHFGKNVNCVVIMTNGKFVSVREPCHKIVEAVRGEENKLKPKNEDRR